MKIGFFTDPHCGDTELCVKTRRPVLSPDKMRRALRYFDAEGVGLVICLGDLINGEGNLEENARYLSLASQILREGNVPFFCLLGNHDLYDADHAFYDLHTGFPPLPLTALAGSVTLIFLDACKLDDERAYFDDGLKPDWKKSYIDRRQLDALRATLDGAPADARFWILTHQSLDPFCEKSHIVLNAAEVRSIIAAHGRGRVERCICGHYHAGSENEIDGVKYTALRAMCNGEKILPGTLMTVDTETGKEIRNAESL